MLKSLTWLIIVPVVGRDVSVRVGPGGPPVVFVAAPVAVVLSAPVVALVPAATGAPVAVLLLPASVAVALVAPAAVAALLPALVAALVPVLLVAPRVTVSWNEGKKSFIENATNVESSQYYLLWPKSGIKAFVVGVISDTSWACACGSKQKKSSL